MTTKSLKILFIISASRTNKLGLAPISCRLTYLGSRKPFNTGLTVRPENWNSKLQTAEPPNEENNILNNHLSLIKNKLNQAFLFLEVQGNGFTVEDIYNQYIGKPTSNNIGLLYYFNQYLEKQQKLIGIEIKQITWNKFNYVRNDVRDFVSSHYKQKDVLLKELDSSFIVDFEYYLKTEKKQKQVTINKALQRFKKVIKTAVISKQLDSFPFAEHKPKKVIKTVVYLTIEELQKLQNHSFVQPRLELVKNLFVFCCYSGLAFNEMARLEHKHISVGFDEQLWIQMIRDKTNKPIAIPLLPACLEIIELYRDENNSFVLPKISNQKFNSYLKEITEILGFEKNLTHHTARKTFASTVLLYHDVPMEIVSELLGHSSIVTTQEYYGKIVSKKVSEAMKSVNKKLLKP